MASRASVGDSESKRVVLKKLLPGEVVGSDQTATSVVLTKIVGSKIVVRAVTPSQRTAKGGMSVLNAQMSFASLLFQFQSLIQPPLSSSLSS